MLTRLDMTGSGLIGEADGTNVTFVTAQPMRLELLVEVFVDGVLRDPDVDNGYTVPDVRTVVLNEAPYDGEQVMVRYCTDPVRVGIPDGTPTDLRAEVLGRSAVSGQPLGPGPVTVSAALLPGPLSAAVDDAGFCSVSVPSP